MKPESKRLLIKQINEEFSSAYLYLSISNFYVSEGLDGFANWYREQAKEEMDHAMRILDYLQANDAAEDIEFSTIAQPSIKFQSKDYRAPLAEAEKHEEYITLRIVEIYSQAIKEEDYGTIQFLGWFIKEQEEEQRTAKDMVCRFELYGRSPEGLYKLNEEMKQRSYVPDKE